MKTYSAKKEDITQEWYLVDAQDRILGRIATQIANILRGKNKPVFTPYADAGDFVIVTNAEKVRLTGNKLENICYYRHTGYPGGLKTRTAQEVLTKRPEDLILLAVKGMLPKNRLGRKLIKKLKIYAGNVHPHEAQQPKLLELREV
ncbi:MAG: 50S ribosomal protein L13 [Proteobacteria bacterium]|nr:50S ribosomal protein L13 [Pseudomonadota bacterium]